jgi:hypothetical protein
VQRPGWRHLDSAVGLVQAVHTDAGGLVKGIARIGPQARATDLPDCTVDACRRTPVSSQDSPARSYCESSPTSWSVCQVHTQNSKLGHANCPGKKYG